MVEVVAKLAGQVGFKILPWSRTRWPRRPRPAARSCRPPAAPTSRLGLLVLDQKIDTSTATGRTKKPSA
jgi:hypothetical protein